MDPQEWLRRARSNLIRAKNRIPGACLEDLCKGAQQAAEKAIKAVYIHRGLAFRYTHDLADLVVELRHAGSTAPKYLDRAKQLTRFAIETRYPGLSGPITERNYYSAVRIAETVLHWAERQLARP
jgi:HEPN domain-containing protein